MTIKVAVTFLLFFVTFASARSFPDVVDALSLFQLISVNGNRSDSGEGAWSSAPFDRHWLQSIVSNVTSNQFPFPTSNMSYECVLDLTFWFDSLKKQEGWAMQSQYYFQLISVDFYLFFLYLVTFR